MPTSRQERGVHPGRRQLTSVTAGLVPAGGARASFCLSTRVASGLVPGAAAPSWWRQMPDVQSVRVRVIRTRGSDSINRVKLNQAGSSPWCTPTSHRLVPCLARVGLGVVGSGRVCVLVLFPQFPFRGFWCGRVTSGLYDVSLDGRLGLRTFPMKWSCG